MENQERNETQERTDRHFRVVKYYSDFGVGVVEDVLGTHLSRDEAEKIVRENPPIVSDEDVRIEDEEASDYGSSTEIYTES